MSVTVARSAGFCWGVRRAVDLVLAELKKSRGPFRVLGPLVHNPQVLQALAERGVECVEDVSGLAGGVLFLRTHGTPLDERKALEGLDARIRDLTCPRVGRALSLASSRRSRGYDIVILGDPGHTEVHALRSSGGGESAYVITGPEDVASLPELAKPFLISQTTQDTSVFARTAEAMAKRFPGLEKESTICDSTEIRQAELRELGPRADCLVVVGGRDSANTARLATIGREMGLPVFLIESDSELDPHALRGYRRVLVTAGASTPSWVIRRVRGRLLELQGQRVGRALALLGAVVSSSLHILPAAFAVGAAGAILTGMTDWFAPVAAASLALYSLQTINSVLECGFYRSASEERQAFIREHRRFLEACSFIALTGSIVISAFLPVLWGGCLAASILMFYLYSLPFLKRSGSLLGGLRAIPGSRDILFAAAWAFLLSILPALSLPERAGMAGIAAWSSSIFLLVLGRSVLLDLVDLQSDAVMGRDTLPLALGWGRSRALFWLCALLPVPLLLAAAAGGILDSPALGVSCGSAWLAVGYLLLRRTPFPSELPARIAADGSLFAAGIFPILLMLFR
jgi:(E)-4-hydroxy-3-methyl-but-2-enyl pyrophosphate reductase